jgi:ATP-dependent Clp protease adaptor protein ClpS
MTELYSVFLLNDDYTPMEFVVDVLQRFFDMERETAKQLMLRVHNEGIGECGSFPRAEAERIAAAIRAHAVEHRHPLQCVLEKKTSRTPPSQ